MTIYKLPLTAATCLTWWWMVSRSSLTEKLIHPDPENDLINPHRRHSPLPPPLLLLLLPLSHSLCLTGFLNRHIPLYLNKNKLSSPLWPLGSLRFKQKHCKRKCVVLFFLKEYSYVLHETIGWIKFIFWCGSHELISIRDGPLPHWLPLLKIRTVASEFEKKYLRWSFLWLPLWPWYIFNWCWSKV